MNEMSEDERREYHAAREVMNQAVDIYCASTRQGTMVSGWVLVLCSVSSEQLEDEARSYSWTMMPGQPYHASLGLMTDVQVSMQYRRES